MDLNFETPIANYLNLKFILASRPPRFLPRRLLPFNCWVGVSLVTDAFSMVEKLQKLKLSSLIPTRKIFC